jgi:hypothetical protein
MPAARALPLALLALALSPAAASAATASVTGDDGAPVPLSTTAQPSIRTMAASVTATVRRNEATAYTTQVLDPAGGTSSGVSPCRTTRLQPTSTVAAAYHGNGVYTLIVRRYTNGSCTAGATEQRFAWAVNAGTAVTPPAGRLLTRAKDATTLADHPFAVAPNPGAPAYELRFAPNATLGPDGGIAGPSDEAPVDAATGAATLHFAIPGSYLVVARARSGDAASPWSAPVTVAVRAPFDLAKVTFPDAKGPGYAVRGRLREAFATGKVTLRAARGRKGGHFHTLGRAKIAHEKGRFTIRFRVHRGGYYRLRFSYQGSTLVAPGHVTQLVRIKR